MSDLTVENMFSENFYTSERLVSGDALTALDRKRMLAHVINDMVSEILTAPGSNPVGLTITVTLKANPFADRPDLLVAASTPQYELSADFFKS